MDLINEIFSKVRYKLLTNNELMIKLNGSADITGGVFEESTFMPEDQKVFPRIHLSIVANPNAEVEQADFEDIYIQLNHFTNDRSRLECSEIENLTRRILHRSSICTPTAKAVTILRDNFYFSGKDDQESNVFKITTRYKIKDAILNDDL